MIVRTNEEVSEARLQEQKTANDRVREVTYKAYLCLTTAYNVQAHPFAELWKGV